MIKKKKRKGENTLATLTALQFKIRKRLSSLEPLFPEQSKEKHIFTYWRNMSYSIWCDSLNCDVQNKLNQFPLRMTHLPQCVVHNVLFQTQQRLWLKSYFLTKLIAWSVVNIPKRDCLSHMNMGLSALIESRWDLLEINDNDH